MNITAETRAALLDGEAYGFALATGAPKHFQDRLVEIRSALVEKRSIPQPSAAYQTRSMAAGHFSRNIVRPKSLQDRFLEIHGYEFRPTPLVRKTNAAKPVVKQTVEQLSKRSGIPVERLIDAENRHRIEKAGKEIAAYNLPTGSMTADEREAMKRRLDVAAGLREPERFPWEIK
jgi:hypothetical protein